MFIEGRKGREGRTNTTIINNLRIVTSLTISHDVLWDYNCPCINVIFSSIL